MNFYSNSNKITFSTSSAYADRPGFSALNVSWFNFGVSVQKQYSKISNSTNNFAYTKRKPFYKLHHYCTNGSQLKLLSNEPSTDTRPLSTTITMELAPKKIMFRRWLSQVLVSTTHIFCMCIRQSLWAFTPITRSCPNCTSNTHISTCSVLAKLDSRKSLWKLRDHFQWQQRESDLSVLETCSIENYMNLQARQHELDSMFLLHPTITP